MSGLIGKKIGMTSVYNENGKIIPCTVIEAGPCFVTQIKTEKTDGYTALQLAFGEKNKKNINRAQAGHLKKAKVENKRKLAEFKNFAKERKLGEKLDVTLFEEGEFVDVSGTSKGKGFQGVVKRHGFKGVGDATHGQHNQQRHGGSIGAASYPARVFKGMHMPGQTGDARVKAINLKVIKIVPEKNILLVKGNVPGHKNAFVKVERY